MLGLVLALCTITGIGAYMFKEWYCPEPLPSTLEYTLSDQNYLSLN